jgi:hypothetical protein
MSERLLSGVFPSSFPNKILYAFFVYHCEKLKSHVSWSACLGVKLNLILREEHELKVIENRLLQRTFGPKRDEVTGQWREWYNKELHNL